jgi:RimJ/RimL family protein N-acetyltransferase
VLLGHEQAPIDSGARGSRAVARIVWRVIDRRYASPMDETVPPLEGSLVRLRAFEPADASTLNPLFIDPDVLAGVGSVRFGQPVAGFRQFLEAGASAETAFFAIETLADRTPIGGCGLTDVEPPSRRASFGIWIGKPYWGRGYGTDATRTICRFGFRQMNLHRIELNVFAWNAGAIRAYEKAGFVLEGTRREDTFAGGQHVDALLMGILEDELRGEPSEERRR